VVAELRAYADESGFHQGAQFCLVSGYIASPPQWRKFDESWRLILRRYAVPDFHSADFFRRELRTNSSNNPYLGWTDQKARAFLTEITSAINQRRLYPISGAVNVEDFMSFSEGERHYLTNAEFVQSGRMRVYGAPSRPYQLAFTTLLNEAAEQTPEGIKVHFTFDRNNVEEGRAVQAFNAISKNQHREIWARLGQIRYAGREDEPGLQAADLYAHCWHHYLVHPDAEASERSTALAWLTKRRKEVKIWDKGGMEILLETLNASQRQTAKEL
jgi:hypothetical protein